MPKGVYERKVGPRKPQFIANCLTCGTEVRVATTSKRKPKYCSSICFGESLKKEDKGHEITCKSCGSKFRGRETSVVCSRNCFYQSRKLQNPKWEDPEYIKMYHRNYAHEARAKGKFDTASIAAKKVSRLSSEDIKFIISKAEGSCVYCGEESMKLTIDHVVPIFHGGRHTKKNLVPCCKSCNSSKGTKPVADWLFAKHGKGGLVRAYVFMTKPKVDKTFYKKGK